tara:strand:+ start:849 stop:3536 length:2688 start_codon:yes stop_codon:yes gene_type:complete
MRLLGVVSFILSCLLTVPLFAEHVPNEIIVRYVNGVEDSEKNATANMFNLEFKKAFRLTNSVLYQVDAKVSLNDLQSKLEKIRSVKYVSFNRVYRKQSLDPDFGKQWYLENKGQTVRFSQGTSGIDIGWLDALGLFQKKKNTFVAVFDSGFAKDHDELDTKNATRGSEKNGEPDVDDNGNGYIDDINGWDFIDNDNDPYDFKGHGTEVAGIIAAELDGVGIQGISDSTYIYPIRVLNRDGNGKTSHLVSALEYVSEVSEFRIVNISLGSTRNDPILEETFQSFEKDNKVLFVCAAGNGGDDGEGDDNDELPVYPASYSSSSIMSVAAIDQTGNLTKFSNFGQESVDVAAPGKNIRVATVEREKVKHIPADGNGWDQTVSFQYPTPWFVYSFSGTPWFVLQEADWPGISSSIQKKIDCSNLKDPYIRLNIDYKIPTVPMGSVTIYAEDLYHERRPIYFAPYGNTIGPRTIEIPVSEFVGSDSVKITFQGIFTTLFDTGHFHVGPIEIFDVDVSSAWKPYYAYNDGTSFSAPIVSGVAAMILSHRPDLLASDVKKILMDSVKPLNSLNGKVESGGMVRADKALQLANTYRTRSSMTFLAANGRKLTENGEIKPSKLVSWNVEGENKDIVMGRVTGAGHYFEGDSITIEAIPESGFLFTGWSQPGADWTSNSSTYTFRSGTSNYSITANFGADNNDSDGDGLSNYWEAYFGTSPNTPHSDGDSLNDLEEWKVYKESKKLKPNVDDNATIAKLRDMLGYGAGVQEGQSLVTSNAKSYGLFNITDMSASTATAKATGIEEGKTIGRIEGRIAGIETVRAEPTLYGLAPIKELTDSGATPHTNEWYYQSEWGWLWTNAKTFPYVYRSSTGGKQAGWLYFREGSFPPYFHDYATGTWTKLGE